MSEAYRITGVERVLGYRPSTIYMKIRDGLLPEPVRLSKRHSIWPSHEIDAWLAALKGARRNRR